MQGFFYFGLCNAAFYAITTLVLAAASLIYICRRGIETLRLAISLLQTNEARMAKTYEELEDELRRRNESRRLRDGQGEEEVEAAAGGSLKQLRRRHRQQQQQQQQQQPAEDISSTTARPATSTATPRGTASSTPLPLSSTTVAAAIKMRKEAIAALGDITSADDDERFGIRETFTSSDD